MRLAHSEGVKPILAHDRCFRVAPHSKLFEKSGRFISWPTEMQLVIAILLDQHERAGLLYGAPCSLQNWHFVAFDVDLDEGDVGYRKTIDWTHGDRSDALGLGNISIGGNVRELAMARVMRKVDFSLGGACCDVQRHHVGEVGRVATEKLEGCRHRLDRDHLLELAGKIDGYRAHVGANIERSSK